MKKRSMFFRMITASLLRRRSRMLIALLSIAIGATILSGLTTIYYDVPSQMGAQFRNYGANMILTPTGTDFSNADFEAAKSLVKADELVGATPYRYQTVRIHEQPIQAAGTQMESVAKTCPYWMIEGAWPQENGQILLGKTIAADLDLQVGDTLSVTFTPEDTTQLDTALDFTVAGIVSTGGNEENYVYMSLEDLADLTGVNDVYDLAELSIATGSEGLNSYLETLGSSSENITASLVKRVTASETTVLSKLQSLILIVTVIVLALTMICVATTMTAVVSERRKEIGLRKAIGASDKSIIAEFMGEGIFLGAIGGLVGALLGFAFAQFVSVHVFAGHISLRFGLIPITVLASVAVTGLACLLPIRSATHVDPALVLKGE